ncbi:uncharacterized protein LOC122295425 [Carya illinoinensis]|uniref:Uncharacterized protein n=1 Tax=Carya illinoinensis TaxID=32201 RepID=A0A8T1NAJ3_CARIL|nr:uncharacterized protein LOC122295425 [Carya illinoinensis]KAG6626861.1 hypothetical protein CIPAW_15G081800 [Carya illinoinensis]
MGDKWKKTKMERKTEKHVEDTEASSSCSASSFGGGSSKKRRRHRHSSDDQESRRENERMTEKRVKERERRRRKLRRDSKKSKVYEYERSRIGSSPDGVVLERPENGPESVLRDMFTEFPCVGNDLLQLLQMVDDGQAVNIRGISERSLIKHIRMLFLSLKLKEDGDRVFLLPEKALPTLEVVGPLIHSLMELKEQQLNHSVPESGVEVEAVDGGCGQEIFENIVSMPSCVEDDSNAPKGREAELEEDNEIFIGSPTLAVVVEAALANEADGFEEVHMDSMKSGRKAKKSSTFIDTLESISFREDSCLEDVLATEERQLQGKGRETSMSALTEVLSKLKEDRKLSPEERWEAVRVASEQQGELIRLKKEKMDTDIMNMDMSKLTPMQAAYFHELQVEILECRRIKS